MILSRCHRSEVSFHDANENVAWYQCLVCHLECDTMQVGHMPTEGENVNNLARELVKTGQTDRIG